MTEFLIVFSIAFVALLILFELRNYLKRKNDLSEKNTEVTPDSELTPEGKTTVANGVKVLGKGIIFIVAIAIVLWFWNTLKESWQEIKTAEKRCLAISENHFDMTRESERLYELKFRLSNVCNEEFTSANFILEIYDGNYQVDDKVLYYLHSFKKFESKHIFEKVYIDKEKYGDVRKYRWVLNVGDEISWRIVAASINSSGYTIRKGSY